MAEEKSLIEYPSAFPIKVMGAQVDGFEAAVTAIKANEAVAGNKKVVFEKEWFAV